MDKKARNKETLIWFNNIGVNLNDVWRLIDRFPNVSEVWEIDKVEIKSIKGLSKKSIDKILKKIDKSKIDNIMEKLDSMNVRVMTVYDEEFPKKLMNIPNKPYLLYVKGKELEDRITIGIVGSRKATDYGKWASKKFTKELSELGVNIVSGMAMGIDKVVHEETLKYNGKTIGVLGNGIDQIYPKCNYDLYQKMEIDGTIITEFPLGEKPMRYNFPQRNRIVSGLSEALIVVEAKERSGTLITANHALEQGKDVFSIPGNINSVFSKGTNNLIRDGAIPLLDMEDILSEVKGLKKLVYKRSREKIDLSSCSKMEIEILEILKEKPQHINQISYMLKIDIQKVKSLLTGMKLKNIIKEISSGTFMIS